MFARKAALSRIGRAAAMATVAAVTLTTVAPSLAYAGAVPAAAGLSAARTSGGVTDISARRRHYRGNGGAAAAAAIAARV